MDFQFKKILNYINGSLCTPSSDQWIDVYDPSKSSVYGIAPRSQVADLNLAVEAAQKASPYWANTSADERAKYLLKIANIIESKFEDFAQAESLDTGKPITLSKKMDIPRSIANLEFFAHAATQFSSESHDMPHMQAINYTLRRPLGTVACISPWNLPLYLFTWKIAPAIAAGNTVIAKPSEITPLTAFLFSQACIEANLPAGVLNIVHGIGHEIGNAITHHPSIKAISFTGSTKVGREIASIAAPMFKKISLEMGGKNSVFIFSDCEYDNTLTNVLRSSFTNQGQICLCGSRIFVHASIYERFKSDLVDLTLAMKIGLPTDPNTQIGAVASEAQYLKIKSYINQAVEDGGKILCGGEGLSLNEGWYIKPTIIEGLDSSCTINQDEVFGPVITIAKFETDEEAIALNNNTSYGLASCIYTLDLKRAHLLASQFDSGIVWVNTWLLRDLRTPFGGMKNSGIGREGGWEAMRFFTETKNIAIQF